jgi:Protein of unknown function (DUF3024)
MPIPEIQIRAALAKAGALIEKRRPKPEIRHLVDMKAELKKQELVLYEVRPRYDDGSKTHANPVAKAKWIDAQGRWRLYWMRADLKWHLYEPGQHLEDISSIIDEIDRDPFGCFWG